jgi:hypothetical protein
LKQDNLSLLEQRLDEIDQNEPCPLFLGQSRSDKNVARKTILSEIDSCLTDYSKITLLHLIECKKLIYVQDLFVERLSRSLSYGTAQEREVQSLRNWVNNKGCLSRNETAYLANTRELMCLAHPADSAMNWLENLVEDMLIRFYKGFRKACGKFEDSGVS